MKQNKPDSVKIMHSEQKLTKEGKSYYVYYCLVTVCNVDFVRKFVIFENKPLERDV